MITVNQAVSIIKSSVIQLKTEYINVQDAFDRILAADIKSKADSPPFDMSSMDGYAVKINKNFNQTKFKVIHEIFAGDNKNFKVLESKTIRVFTGSKMPLGANRVIIQENCKITNKSEITAKINNSDELYIRKKGQDFKKGTLILRKQHQINSRDIGLLVTSGIKKVLVFKKPKIAILATGNELINIDKKIRKSQIYASSLYMLKELVNGCNSNCKVLKIIKDNEISIKKNKILYICVTIVGWCECIFENPHNVTGWYYILIGRNGTANTRNERIGSVAFFSGSGHPNRFGGRGVTASQSWHDFGNFRKSRAR